jgi:hypothetical protein
MTSTILLLLARDGSLDSVLARYTAAMKAMPSFEVQSNFRSLHGTVSADFVLDGKKRLLYDAKSFDGEHYILSVAPPRYREVDLATRVYEEYPYPGGAYVFPSRISELPATIPSWLRSPTIRQMMQPKAKLTLQGSQVIGGVTYDDIHGVYKDAMGTATYDILVPPSGLIYSFHKVSQSVMGRSDETWLISGYKSAAHISSSRFDNRIPDGFMPYVLPDRYAVVPAGRKLNLQGWVDSSTGRAWSKQAGKPLLFIVAGADSLPCKRAIAEIGKWRPVLAKSGVQVAIASDEASRSEAKGLLYDPDQRSIRSMDIPSTPMFFLVDRGGTLRNLWLGFSPSSAGKLQSDVLNAVKALKS